MDISYVKENNRFNYRVAGIIIDNQKVLAMKDERSPFYYLPGGRVTLMETAEDAILRELKEELDIDAKIIRPLWFHQSFFNEDVDHLDYHELCLYFLVDAGEDLLKRGPSFKGKEKGHQHIFEWLNFQDLKREYFYPLFLKEEIFHLPDELTIRTDREIGNIEQ